MLNENDLANILFLFEDLKVSLEKLSKNNMHEYFLQKDKFKELVDQTKELVKPKSKQHVWCCTCNKHVQLSHSNFNNSHPLFYGEDAKHAKEVYLCRNSKRKCTCGAHVSKVMNLK